jgi:hypothetical protein
MRRFSCITVLAAAGSLHKSALAARCSNPANFLRAASGSKTPPEQVQYLLYLFDLLLVFGLHPNSL